MRKAFQLLLAAALCAGIRTAAATTDGFELSVPVCGVRAEGGLTPEAYLHTPPGCDSVRALMFAFQNMNEETLMRMPRFRERMERAGVGLLWIAPGFGQEWHPDSTDMNAAFFGMLDSLAAASGHSELARVPLIAFGHSAQATMPWNFAAVNPSRTLCVISYHGDAPRTNLCGYGRANAEWGRTRNIDGIPGIMLMGEYEWWEARLRPALAFRMMYPAACVSFLGDAGRGHFDVGAETADYLALFIEKSLERRLLPDGGLAPVDPADGVLAASWLPDGDARRPAPARPDDYTGCRHEAFWYFDAEMAALAEARYAATDGKKPCHIAFTDTAGSLLPYNARAHCRQSMELRADAQGRFGAAAVFTDSTRTVRSACRPDSAISVHYVSGPARELAPGLFEVVADHPSWRNPKRRGRVTLCAEAPADSVYKGCVQGIEIVLR